RVLGRGVRAVLAARAGAARRRRALAGPRARRRWGAGAVRRPPPLGVLARRPPGRGQGVPVHRRDPRGGPRPRAERLRLAGRLRYARSGPAPALLTPHLA